RVRRRPHRRGVGRAGAEGRDVGEFRCSGAPFVGLGCRPVRLRAAEGLELVSSDAGSWHVAWGERDWLGPVRARIAGALAGELVAGVHSTGGDELGDFERLELVIPRSPLAIAVSVRAYHTRPLLAFRLEAREGLEGITGGGLDDPAVAFPVFFPAERAPGGAPAGARGFGHQYTQFALPSASGGELSDFWLAPIGPKLALVSPLWL